MKFMLLALLSLSVACNETEPAPVVVPDSAPEETCMEFTEVPEIILQKQVVTLTPAQDCVPVVWNSNVMFIGFSTTQRTKIDTAISLMKQVIQSTEFKEKVLNHTYNGVKAFVDNGGLTNAQIYEKIMTGAETLQPTANQTMDVEVELYYADNSTVGYTYPTSKRIWMNKKFFNTFTPATVSSNLTHEWLHKLGFKHASSYSESRDYSIPYAVGRIVSSLARTID